MSRCFQNFTNFFKSFARIEKTPLSLIILILPITLGFIVVQLIIINSSKEVGAVVSNAEQCAEAGEEMLRHGGSVVDAAIATMLCEGVYLSNRVGLGGGFTAIMYINGAIDSISATAAVPARFSDEYLKLENLAPALAVGVPGELLGYWSMHQKYGKLPWKWLFEPAIKKCSFYREDWHELAIGEQHFETPESQVISKMNGKQINETLPVGLVLEKTLRKVAKEGADVFYKGQVGKALIEDLRKVGGIMTEDDLRNYKVRWDKKPLSLKLTPTLKAYTTPLPSAGAIVVLAMNIIKNLSYKKEPLFWHKVIEASKYAYGLAYGLTDVEHETDNGIREHVKRVYNEMTDMDFAASIRDSISDNAAGNQTENSYYDRIFARYMSSTANICVLSRGGNAIAITTSLMSPNGKEIISPRTGILLNDEMTNFRTSDNTSYVRPGKRAMSAHCPTIVIGRQNAQVRFVVGASGENYAPAQVIAALIDYSLLKMRAFDAANDWFFQPDVFKNIIYYGVHSLDVEDEQVMAFLDRVGHVMAPAQMEDPSVTRTCIGHSFLSSDAQYTISKGGSTAIIEPDPKLNIPTVVLIVGVIILILLIQSYEIIRFNDQSREQGRQGL